MVQIVDRLMFQIQLSMETVHLDSFYNSFMGKVGIYSESPSISLEAKKKDLASF